MTGQELALAIDDARWPVALTADYTGGDRTLLALYRKCEAQHWDADRDIDWAVPLDPANPLKIPDDAMELQGTELWRRIGAAERDRIRHHLQAWRLSQILHGEQAGMLCAAKMVAGATELATKLFAAGQMADEARHVDVYSRLLRTHFSAIYPLDPSLGTLLDQVLRDPRHDMINLGVQIMVEGIALASFRRIHAYSQEAFVKTLIAYVVKDEARHFAAGRLMFRAHARQFSEAERAEREEFICEAALRLRDHLFAREVWTLLGLPANECAQILRGSQNMRNIHRSLFRQLVPAIREAGLLGGRAVKVFEELGVIEYASFPLSDFEA
jgi:hypothetical protein